MKILHIFLLFLCSFLYSQSIEDIRKNVIEQETTTDALLYLENQIDNKNIPSAEKLELFKLKGFIEEQNNDYTSAQATYLQAASLAQTSQKSELQLLAAYCALNTGDVENASVLINSSLLTAHSQEVLIKARLYAIWADLIKDTEGSRFTENVNTLQFLSQNSYSQKERPAILFTLWWVTSDVKFAQELERTFPKSPETAIVRGSSQALPAPFVYFIPRIAAVRASSSF